MISNKLIEEADNLKHKIEIVRPLGVADIKELDEYFRIGLTYSSNALEGNTLTISETKVLLEDGITAGGKPLKDLLEALGHSNAFDFMLDTARKLDTNIDEKIILKLHRLFYQKINEEQAGIYRRKDVYITGTDYIPQKWEDVPYEMQKFIKNINSIKDEVHPITYAALLHKGLVDIHPFVDGNGRTARLLMNIALVNSGYGIVCISPVVRNDYINALRISQKNSNPSNDVFINFIAECVIETQKDYCRLLRLNEKTSIEQENEEEYESEM